MFKIGDRVEINLEAEINKENNYYFCSSRVSFLISKTFHVITGLDGVEIRLSGYDGSIDSGRVKLYKPHKISWTSVK